MKEIKKEKKGKEYKEGVKEKRACQRKEKGEKK